MSAQYNEKNLTPCEELTINETQLLNQNANNKLPIVNKAPSSQNNGKQQGKLNFGLVGLHYSCLYALKTFKKT